MLKREKRIRQDLCEGPFLRKIIVYTVPVVLTGILQLLFNAADLMILGQFTGEDNVGAVGATGSLINMLVSLFTGLAMGAGVCVARNIGAKQDDQVHKIVHTAMPAAFIGGGILTVAGIFLARWFLELMATPVNLLPAATLYMQIYFAGSIPMLLYNFGTAILRSAGDTKSPLIYLTVAGVVNVALNVFFVLVLHMSVAGVALATTLSQTLSCVLVLRKLMIRDDACKLVLRKMRINLDALSRILAIGVPAGLQSSLFAVSNVIVQSAVNSFNVEAINNGFSAASNIEGFIYVGMDALNQSVTTFVGQNSGAGKYKNVGKIIWISLACVITVGITMGFSAWMFAPQLLGLYLQKGSQAVQYGITRITYVGLFYFLCGIMNVLSGSLRGMGYSVTPMVGTVLGACVLRVVWIYTIFQIHHTLSGLLLMFPVSWIVTVVVLGICLLIGLQRRKKQVAQRRIPSN